MAVGTGWTNGDAKELRNIRIALRDIADALMAKSDAPKCETVCVSAFGQECGCTVVACEGPADDAA